MPTIIGTYVQSSHEHGDVRHAVREDGNFAVTWCGQHSTVIVDPDSADKTPTCRECRRALESAHVDELEREHYSRHGLDRVIDLGR